MKLPALPPGKTTLLLRIYLGFTFMLHGSARLYYGSVNDFGGFLNSKGLLIGVFLAWSITIGEIIGGFLLAIGYKTKYILIFHFLVVLGGIFYVHLQDGFFVVGHGRNGVEYSLLILFVILVLYSKADKT